MIADGEYIPIEINSNSIGYFHPISLLSVEENIYFAVLTSGLTYLLLINEFINALVQKSGVPWIAGCLEHWNQICEAFQKTNKNDLDIIWLDLANA